MFIINLLLSTHKIKNRNNQGTAKLSNCLRAKLLSKTCLPKFFCLLKCFGICLLYDLGLYSPIKAYFQYKKYIVSIQTRTKLIKRLLDQLKNQLPIDLNHNKILDVKIPPYTHSFKIFYILLYVKIASNQSVY